MPFDFDFSSDFSTCSMILGSILTVERGSASRYSMQSTFHNTSQKPTDISVMKFSYCWYFWHERENNEEFQMKTQKSAMQFFKWTLVIGR